jgi:DNA replication and repair protein RecF
MSLSTLNINNFRNFYHVELAFHDKCNLFYGKNGSGKTSLLEAIYYLTLGRSFRSHLLRRIVKYGENEFSLFGKIQQENKIIAAVGITKSTEHGKQIKISGKNVTSTIEITKLSPLQLLTHNSYLLLYEGSKTRRQFMDWGLFHVEQSFLDLWRKVERLLEQRNAAIRIKASPDYIKAWDKDLSSLGFELHNYRKRYIDNFIPTVHEVLQKLSCEFLVDLCYSAGWDTNIELLSVLNNNLKKDLQLGYTTAGPHRADLQISIGKVPAKDALSRGQQKFLLYGLQIAQGILLNKLKDKKCIYLVDDLLAELDLQKCKLLANVLLNLPKSQIFITGLTREDLENILVDGSESYDRKIFHLNEGIVTD